jgi:mono/diheme cytochrome c family protein
VTKQTMALVATAATLVLAGCRQDMHDQPKFFPQRGMPFFQDGRSVRPQVENTVARGQLHEDAYFNTGMVNGKEGDGMPFPATLAVLERGQERYNVYCAPCHSRVGNGNGMVVQRGYRVAGDFHSARLTGAPLGHFFNVMTNGLGAMPDYSAQLMPSDRWAVAAYIRALQLSQNAKQGDIPAGAKVEDLSKITTDAGLPEGFLNDWKLPATAAAPVTTVPAPAQQVKPPAGAAAPAAPAVQNNKSQVLPAGHPAMVAPSSADIAAGHELYAHNCQGCHTAARTGRPPAIPSLVGAVSRIGTAKVQQTIANGAVTGAMAMPAFGSRLSSTDIQHVIAYLANPGTVAAGQAGN